MVALLDARRRRAVYLRTKLGLINGLRLFWVAAVLWFEVGTFLWSLLGCRWPDKTLTSKAYSKHILLVADPQVLDDRSYPGRPQWLMNLTRYIVDFNLRKSWNAVFMRFNPHVVIFMGDMMDNGRSNVDEHEYSRYYDRFKSIFQLDVSIPVHYMPGNHDVDLGSSSRLSARARDHYQSHFGAMNQRVDIANHTLVLFDAPGLVDEDYRRHTAQKRLHDWRGSKGGAVEFLKDFVEHRPNGPVVLLSHIPLSRSDRVSCGPLREKGTIHPGVGKGYQNLIIRETSTFMLEHIRPSVVFSADDHDYCEYFHHLVDGTTIREVTIRSFSMAMGIRRPGFQLLSLGNTGPVTHGPSSLPPTTLADAPCLLPDQIRLYTHGYAPLALVTAFALLVLNFKHRHHRSHSRGKSWTEKASQASSYLFSPITSSASSSPIMRRQSPPLKPQRDASNTPASIPLGSGLVPPPFLPDGDEESQNSFGMSNTLSESHLRGPELDEPYHPPVLGKRIVSSLEQERVPWSAARALPEGLFTLLQAGQACYTRWTCGSGQYPWYGRAIRDLCQVAWPPVWVYLIINLWLFWR